MKNVLWLFFFVFFAVNGVYLAALKADPSMQINCSEISMISYSKNTNQPTKVIIQLRNGKFLHKTATEPNGLLEASQFANDLKTCSRALFYYTPINENAYNVTTYQLYLR